MPDQVVAVPDEFEGIRTSSERAWSPIPVTIEHHIPAEHTFTSAPQSPQPPVPPAAPLPPAPAASRPPTSTVAPLVDTGLPKRVRRLGPVNADAIQPTGPTPKFDLFSPIGSPSPASIDPSRPAHLVVDAPAVPVFAPAAPANVFTAPTEIFPNVPRPSVVSTEPFATASAGYAQPRRAPTAEDLASWPPPAVGPPAAESDDSYASPAEAHSSPSVRDAPTFVTAPVASPVLVVPGGSAVPAVHPGTVHPGTLHAGTQHQPVPAGAVVDWRILAFVGLLGAYVPLLVRSLIGVRLANPLATTGLAVLMVPLAFAVFATRRPNRSNSPSRHVDLVVGAGAAVISLICTWVLPHSLGERYGLWRPDLLALPFALFTLYTLLWGVRFAWDMRNSLLIAVLAGPVVFVPMLGRSFTPLSGDINTFAYDIAGYALPIESVGYASIRAGAPVRGIDARGLVEGRALTVVAIVIMVGLLLVSRVDGRARPGRSGLTAGLSRWIRKLSVLACSLSTFWVVDLIVSTVAIVFAGFAPERWARYITSPVVGLLPTLVALHTFLGWCGRFGLFLPGKIKVVASATTLPAHGPRSRSDHALTLAIIGTVIAAALVAGLRPMLQPVASAPPSTDVTATVTPKGWTQADPVRVTALQSYYGADSTWVRTRLDGPADATLDQVNIDMVTSSVDLLRMFGATATFDLGTFRPVRSNTVDLRNGFTAVQDTYYDTADASTWSIASVLIETSTGVHRISLSAVATGDSSPVPVPAPNASRSLLTRTSAPVPALGMEERDQKISDTTGAVAKLFRSYLTGLQPGVSSADGAAQDPNNDERNDIVDDAGFVQ